MCGDQKLIDHVCRNIKNMIFEFQNDPFMYLYEAGVQADLYFRLARSWPLDQNVTIKGWEVKEKDPLDTRSATGTMSPFQCQYPHPRGKTGLFDIAFIDTETVKNVRNGNTEANTYDLPVLVAIEIKLCKPTDEITNEYIKDIKKLMDYPEEKYKNQKHEVGFTGIAVCLCQRNDEFDEISTKTNDTNINGRSLKFIIQSLNKLQLQRGTVYSILVPPGKGKDIWIDLYPNQSVSQEPKP